MLDSLQVMFRALVGAGYQTLQSLLLDFCKWQPSEGLLNALLDMLVDGNFNIKENVVIQVGYQEIHSIWIIMKSLTLCQALL